MDEILIQAEESAWIIGPQCVSQIGGQSGFRIRTTGEAGKIRFSAKARNLTSDKIKITVK